MWPEDAVFMERNSRDFVSRNDRINANAEAVCEVLHQSPIGKHLEGSSLRSANSHGSSGAVLPQVCGESAPL